MHTVLSDITFINLICNWLGCSMILMFFVKSIIVMRSYEARLGYAGVRY